MKILRFRSAKSLRRQDHATLRPHTPAAAHARRNPFLSANENAVPRSDTLPGCTIAATTAWFRSAHLRVER
ncbi:hypothetical protein, partial [Brevibacterium sp. NPDC056947]|uniref:hypothetical protein n=1 Tax=Brevibacterium sp. NPDC056947 TaxID=3345974 RepID=UPI0036300D1D